MAQYDEANLPQGITASDLRQFERSDRLAKMYTEKRSRLRDKIVAAFGKGTHTFEFVVVKRSDARVVDAKQIAEDFPYEKFPQYYSHSLDMAKVPASVKDSYTEVQERVSVTSAR